MLDGMGCELLPKAVCLKYMGLPCTSCVCCTHHVFYVLSGILLHLFTLLRQSIGSRVTFVRSLSPAVRHHPLNLRLTGPLNTYSGELK